TMSLVIRFSLDPSCAARHFQEPPGRQAFPPEGVIPRSVAAQVLEPFDRLLHRWRVAYRHPPHHGIGAIELLEPLAAPAVEALVYRLPDVGLERLDIRPHRHVDRHPRLVALGPLVRAIPLTTL